MNLISQNSYLICKPYKLPEGNNGLLIGKNSDCFAEVCFCKENSSYSKDNVIWYDKAFARECVISGETYIAIDEKNVIAIVGGV